MTIRLQWLRWGGTSLLAKGAARVSNCIHSTAGHSTNYVAQQKKSRYGPGGHGGHCRCHHGPASLGQRNRHAGAVLQPARESLSSTANRGCPATTGERLPYLSFS